MRSFILNMTKYLLHCTCIFNYDVTEILLQVALNIITLTYFYLPEGRSSACLTSIRILFRLKLINLSNTNRIRGPNR